MLLSSAIFVISLGLLSPFMGDALPTGYQFVSNTSWIQSPSDPVSTSAWMDSRLWLVLLSTLLTPIAVLISWKYIDHRIKEYFAFLMLLEFGVIGVFVSLDLFLFYVFWEVSLVPMYFLIGIWGHERRIYAAVKFFLFTMAGSVLMLAAIIYLYNVTGTFDYVSIQQMVQAWLAHLHADYGTAALPGFLHRLRDQGAAVPAAHMVAGRARGSAHRWFRHAGLGHAEDGYLRTRPFLPHPLPGCCANGLLPGLVASP